MHLPDYLQRSRHGIWYYRWVVPLALRQRNPALPKEVKRSTRTTDIRLARAIARGLHYAAISRPYFRPDMSQLPLGFSIKKFEAEFDPTTGALTKLNATPEEMPAVLELVEAQMSVHKMMSERIAAAGEEHASKQSNMATQRVDVQVPLPAPSSRGVGADILISEAFTKYARLQINSNVWTEETKRYTHEPTIELFRQLVGVRQAVPEAADVNPQFDLALSALTPPVMSQFLDEFWRFPSRQGKRDGSLNARELLAAGGKPQSRANVFKRLGHIKQFLNDCVDGKLLDPGVLTELNQVLSKDTKRSRDKDAMARVASGREAASGYVAFTNDEIRLLFGAKFLEHVRGFPDRYWIPLIARCTGMRVGEVSQLRPDDFIETEGVPCIDLRPREATKCGHPATRLKTLSSIRRIPLHPWLISLGLLKYVEERRKTGQALMWDGLLWTAKSGYGKYPGRDFTLLSQATGVYVFRRKVFHSFRATLSQALKRQDLEHELIEQLLGHDVDSEGYRSYNRSDDGDDVPIKRVYRALCAVPMSLPVPLYTDLFGKLYVVHTQNHRRRNAKPARVTGRFDQAPITVSGKCR